MTLETAPEAPRIRNSGESLRSWISSAKYLGILLLLLAVGFAGHQTHLSFGFTKHTEESAHSSPSSKDGFPARELDEDHSDAWSVQFPSARSIERSGVRTVAIDQRPIRERVKITGVIGYDERMFASLSARVSGTVWRVLKHPGDAVHRGDVLVIIDAVEVGRAKAEFFSDLVEVESKTEIQTMLEKASGAVPERQVREARVAVREAKIRLQITEQALINMGFGFRKEDFFELTDAERAAKLHFLGLPESVAKDLDPTQTTSNLLPLAASFDGVLLHHDAALGETVEAGKPLLEVADMRRMWLKLDVPKEDAAKLVIGQSVRFLPDGLDEELDSTITWISTEMNSQTRTLRVRAEVENPIVSMDPVTGSEVRILRANTFGVGIITLKDTPSAFVVPASAVVHADHQPIIFAKVGELRLARIDVKLGVREHNAVQIESEELQPGMEVVSQGSHVLKSECILNRVASAAP